MSKAWKACDCGSGLQTLVAAVTGAVSAGLSLLPTVSKVPDKTIEVLSTLFNVPVANCTGIDAVGQWVAAAAAQMPLPQTIVDATKLSELTLGRQDRQVSMPV